MTEREDDREAERTAAGAYRQLPREEPPASIDARIRARAREAVETHPAPLVPPTGRRQWYFPVAAAAVVVLAVAVTWRMEREQPDAGDMLGPQAVEPQAPPQQAPQRQAPQQQGALRAPSSLAQEAKPKARKTEEPPQRPALTRERMQRDEAASRPNPAAAPSAAASETAENRAQALAKQVSPQAELERIAALRRQGRDEEADRALAEFRKRYPGYRIAPEMLEKVEKK